MPVPVQATIILPTTADRGLLVPLCVSSIQRQTLQSFELFIIGDGVDESTRAVINDLVRQDDRISFFDHPKQARRGEVYRHQALQEARGQFVAYICDRDLWLPNHLDILANYLQKATLVTTNFYYVRRNQELVIPYLYTSPVETARGILSAAGHRLDFYHRLPYGWRTTPANRPTDLYMWEQMLAQADCRVAVAWQPTLLYFKRNDHPGWPTAQRYEELVRWTALLKDTSALQSAMDKALMGVIYERNRYKESWLLLRGKRVTDLPGLFKRKLRRWLKLPEDQPVEERWLPAPIKLDL